MFFRAIYLILTQRRRSSWVILGAVALVGFYLSLGTSGTLDRALSTMRFGVTHRTASGQVVVVEMDAKSAASIKRWPWSRSNYAAVVDRLREAGAATIVFDVDFSSLSEEQGDRALAAAVSRAQGRVVLPTFGQSASSADQRTINSIPIAALRSNAALASVSIAPDPDGEVRSMPFGTVTAGTPRPSLSAYIAQRSGATDLLFPIDMSIVPSTIPRLSFIDVRDGKFDPAIIQGRAVLIGATAIEMGDRYSTPQWGVLPGVIVQAMATETLLRGVPVNGSPVVPVLLALLGAAVIIASRSIISMIISACGAATVVIVHILIAQHVELVTYPMAAALGIISLAGALCFAREAVGRFKRQRTTDEATGLRNAKALLASPGELGAVTLAVVQINNYDNLVAVLGQHSASEILVRVSQRLALVASRQEVFRTTDRHLAMALSADEPPSDTLDGLRQVLLQPVEVSGRRVDVEVSVGVATDGSSLDKLLVAATLAADEAQKAGAFWRHSVADLDERELAISLMGELDDALLAGQIDVFYQPKYSLREDRITSVEALVRWHHPTRGFISPDVFIPLAEKTNRIAPMTLFVLRRVVRDLAAWRNDHGNVTAAVNISANLLSSQTFNSDVEETLEASEVPASALVFEVTELAAMSDPARAIAALRHYRSLGIAVSMDDYGTGQSTLTYLRQLPLNELKIDRSFVQHAHLNKNDAVLVRSTIALAHELGLKVVAEGVEDVECMAFLKGSGCDLVQGYLISRPVPLLQFLNLLDRRFSAAA